MKKDILILFLINLMLFTNLNAAEQGLPLTEDFSDTTLRDLSKTTANWSTEEKAVFMSWAKSQSPKFSATGSNIGLEQDQTRALVVVDVDNDGDLDVIAGNYGQPNKLYKNNGMGGFIASSNIDPESVPETYNTRSLIAIDVDGDGDLDVIAGNDGEINKLYKNNGMGGFEAGIDIGTETDRTFALVAVDVDKDGDLDVIAGNLRQNKLYKNNGTGVFAVAENLGSEEDATFSLVAADVDSDGDLDVITGNQSLQTNKLYLNDGDGVFSAGGTILGSESDFTTSLVAADIDNDGDLDVIAGNSGQTNKLYINSGIGVFDVVTSIGSESDFTTSLVAADIDNDGDLDVIVGNNGQTNKFYLNDGAGIFSSSGTIQGSEMDSSLALVAADIDGDGDLDVIAGNSGQTNKLYLNNGTGGGFNSTGTNLGTEADSANALVAADINGDGHLDVIAGNSGQTNKLYLNDGMGGISATGTDIGLESDDTRSLVAVDVDNDGDLDVIAGNYSQTNKLYINGGVGVFSATVSDLGSETHKTYSLIAVDVDRDGDLDVITGNDGETNKLYKNDGGEFSATGADIGSETDLTYALVAADVDNDGNLDVIVGNKDQTNKLYKNNGTGGFNSAITIGTETDFTFSLVAADVDSDGDLDVIAGNVARTNKLYLNDGTGSFSDTGSDLGSEIDRTFALLAIDVDGDRDLDIIAGDFRKTNKLYFNDGTGVFSTTGTNLGSENDDTLSLVAADIDEDGDLDVISGNFGQTNKLYLNNVTGGGFNTAGTDLGSETGFVEDLVAADIDNDGDLDVIVGNSGNTNKLYKNDGTGGFSATGSDLGSESDFTLSLIVADVNNDGNLDVIAGNKGQTNKLYKNNGMGGFNAATIIGSEEDNTYALVAADVDNDGDLDVVVGNQNQTNKFYLNGGAGDFSATGFELGSDKDGTFALVAADVDSDGDLDVIAGNYGQTNKLYLYNVTGTGGGFNTAGTDLGSEIDKTRSLLVADVDNDGDLDVIAGNEGRNKLYLKNGTGTFSTTGSNLGSEEDNTYALVAADVDNDGDLDVITGNAEATNKLYKNDSTGSFSSSGTNLGSETDRTYALIAADIDRDGDLDVIAGNLDQTMKLYRTNKFNTSNQIVTSLKTNSGSDNIPAVTLSATTMNDSHTAVNYYLSNNGGSNWYLAYHNQLHTFSTTGNDLRWRAELVSKSPVSTTRITEVQLTLPDTTSPSISISGVPTNSNSGFTATFTFSEAVTGFDAADITLSNATKGTFTAVSTTVYTLVINPTDNGNVTVDVAANVAMDAATNGNTVATQATSVYDVTKPNVAISGVPANSNSGFTATFTFSEAVTGFAAADITLGNATKGTFAAVSGTVYTLVINPTANGNVTVDVAANVAMDIASNGNTATTQATSAYDVTKPNVAISGVPANSNSGFTATFTFSEAVTGFAAADITLGNATKGTFTAVSGTVYTLVINPTANGNVTVDVAANAAMDAATNGNTVAVQAVSAYDVTKPSVVISGVPANSNSGFTATFTFSEAVTGFAAADITLGNATKGTFTAVSTTVYTLVINPTANGNVTVDVAANVAMDAATNGNTVAVQAVSAYDVTKPSVVISGVPANSNSGFTATFTFSEAVTGFAAADITLGNATKGAFSAVSGTVYTLVINPTAHGNVTVDVAANVAMDAATNGNTVAAQAVSAFVNRYTIKVYVSGLIGDKMVIRNSATDITITGNRFNTISTLDNGSNYSLSISTQPMAPKQLCKFTNSDNSGTVNGSDVTIVVNCETNKYFIGGSVSGLLKRNVLVLQNNSADDKTITANGAFIFSTPLADLSGYDVTVKTNPASPIQTCQVNNGKANLSGIDITNVEVVCEHIESKDLIYRFGFEGGDPNQ